MKFKKILLGTLMTAVTVTALASCKDKTVDPKTPVEPTPTVETYTATFKQDGTTLKVYTFDKGTQISYTAVTPTKDADANYTYTFKGWDYTNDGVVDALPTISADIVFEAVFERTEKVVASHTVQVIDRGNVVYTGLVKEGESVTITGVSTPENYEDDTYTYTFAGWTYNGTLVTTLSGYTMGTSDMTFTAYYNRTEKSQNQGGGENTGGEQGGEQGGQGEQGGNVQTEEFTISYYDGTELVDTQTTSSGHVNPSPLSKDGYKFLGWTNASGEIVDVINTTFTSNATLYAKWEKINLTNNALKVKNAFTEYDRPFTRTSRICDAFNGTSTWYLMVENYVPNTSYVRTIYKDATNITEISDENIVETLTIIASDHTYTFNGASHDYTEYFSSFNEMFEKIWQSDLSEATRFMYVEGSDGVAYSYKFNEPFYEKINEFSNLINEKIEIEKDNFEIEPESITYEKGDYYYYFYQDLEEVSFEATYSGSTTGIHYYDYSITLTFTD